MPETQFVEILVAADDMPDIARKLLAAADDPEQIQTLTLPNGFRVPKSIAAKAGYTAEEGDVAVVDARAVEGYALDHVTGVQTEAGAKGITAARQINRTDQPAGTEPGEGTETGGLGDAEVADELERSGQQTERVDDQPPLGAHENVTTTGDGTHLHNNEITGTNFAGADARTTEDAGTAEDDEEDLTVEQAQELKGEALDNALKDRGLSYTTGTADEKRQRLVDFLRG